MLCTLPLKVYDFCAHNQLVTRQAFNMGANSRPAIMQRGSHQDAAQLHVCGAVKADVALYSGREAGAADYGPDRRPLLEPVPRPSSFPAAKLPSPLADLTFSMVEKRTGTPPAAASAAAMRSGVGGCQQGSTATVYTGCPGCLRLKREFEANTS